MRLAVIAALLCLVGCAHQAKECACATIGSEPPPPQEWPYNPGTPVMCWGDGDTRHCDEIGELVIPLSGSD